MIIQHPLPRTDGIAFRVDPGVDETPYALYFEDVFYGVVTRMVILGGGDLASDKVSDCSH